MVWFDWEYYSRLHMRSLRSTDLVPTSGGSGSWSHAMINTVLFFLSCRLRSINTPQHKAHTVESQLPGNITQPLCGFKLEWMRHHEARNAGVPGPLYPPQPQSHQHPYSTALNLLRCFYFHPSTHWFHMHSFHHANTLTKPGSLPIITIAPYYRPEVF